MSKLGIGLLYFALLGALVAIGAGYFEVQKLNTTQENLIQTQAAKEASDKAKNKAQAEALAAQQAQADAEGKLKTANDNIGDLNTQLTSAKKAADDATGALAQAKADGDKAKADLAAINDKLGGKTVDDLKAAQAKAEQDLYASQSEQKILEDNVQSLNKKVADLNDAINRKITGTMPPGISGKITAVNRAWNFVVLDVGLNNGVVPNGELIVYRKNTFLGKVKVTSVDANSAVADIMPNVKADIQVGDYVLN